MGNDTFAIFASGLMHSRLWLTGDGDGDGDDDGGGESNDTGDGVRRDGDSVVMMVIVMVHYL